MNHQTAAYNIFFIGALRLGGLVDIAMHHDEDKIIDLLCLAMAAHTIQTGLVSFHVYFDESAALARSFLGLEALSSVALYAPVFFVIYGWEFCLPPMAFGLWLWYLQYKITQNLSDYNPIQYSSEYHRFATVSDRETTE